MTLRDPATGHDDLFPEASHLLSWAASIASSPSCDASASRSICEVFDRYLEQSALLDPVLPRLLRDLASAALSPSARPRHHVFFVLYSAAKTRGPKHVTRLLPHDPASFRALARRLRSAFPDGESQSQNWATHYVLLLWLSAAVLVPFPLESIVKTEDVQALYEHAVAALFASSKVSDGAVEFLAAFLTRRDTTLYVRQFMMFCVEKPATGGAKAAAALAKIFKKGRRGELVEFVPPLMRVVGMLVDETEMGGMKLKAKLVQRMGLLFLKEYPCTWRYNRGSRMLFGAAAPLSTPCEGSPSDPPPVVVASRKYVGEIEESESTPSREKWIESEEEDILEEVIEILLCGLRHRDTVVRWSAAKGIGRITGRLPQEHAEDVVQALVDLFTSPAVARADSTWHGGCLALAELARRGLILPGTPHFAALFRVVATAAAFDVRRGAHSVGAHVRDAACYVVWAMARAYSSADVTTHSQSITETIVPVALLDREVNCRRAASAALQETVGRLAQGVVVEGIELVTLIDYFSLGDKIGSYTRIAPKVAALAGGIYFDCIMNELWASKLVHWDASIRALAAKSLAALVPVDGKKMLLSTVFPNLLDVVVKRGDAIHRHGAVLGLAELTALLGSSLSSDVKKALRLVPGRMAKKGYFTGRVGDMTCMAICKLIEECANCDFEMYSVEGNNCVAAADALSVLERALGTGKDELCVAGVRAYERLCQSAMAGDPAWRASVAARVADGLTASNLPEIQRGFALAAGALGPALVTDDICRILLSCVKEHTDVDVRRNAAVSLGRLGPVSDGNQLLSMVHTLHAGMLDYAIDDRGDVGSWVREAAMTSFASLIVSSTARCKRSSSVEDSPVCTSRTEISDEGYGPVDHACAIALDGIVRQSCERIARTRRVAGAALERLVGTFSDGSRSEILPETTLSLVRLKTALVWGEEDVCHEFPSRDDSKVHSDPSCLNKQRSPEYSPLFNPWNTQWACDQLARNLLSLPEGWQAALAGMIACCGGTAGAADGSTGRRALECIFDHAGALRRAPSGEEQLAELGNAIIAITAGMEDRLVAPSMVATEFLVRRGVFSVDRSGHMERFLLDAVSSARSTWKGRLRDVPRVSAAVSLLCELAMVRVRTIVQEKGKAHRQQPVSVARVASLEALVVVLAGPVPRLRRVAAEALYIVLTDWMGCDVPANAPVVGHDGECGGQDGVDVGERKLGQALEVVADISWEQLSVPEARKMRNQLCGILSIEYPRAPGRAAVACPGIAGDSH